MLKRPISVTTSGDAQRAMNSALRGAGRPSASISQASSSSPAIGACCDSCVALDQVVQPVGLGAQRTLEAHEVAVLE